MSELNALRELDALLAEEVSRERQNIKDREAPSNGRLPIAARKRRVTRHPNAVLWVHVT